MNDYIVETKNLTKQYGAQKSVANLNIHVRKGRIYGLLGRNGAGKTTTMKMLLGLTKPTSGEVMIWGQPLPGNEKKLLSRIGSLIALLADDIGIIDKGVLLEEETLAELEAKSSRHIRFTVSDTAQAARILEHTFREYHFTVLDDHRLQLGNMDLSVGRIVTAFVANGLEVSEAAAFEESLARSLHRVTGGEGSG